MSVHAEYPFLNLGKWEKLSRMSEKHLYLLAVALSYMFSGYHGLYSSQKILYSKFKTTYIDRQAR